MVSDIGYHIDRGNAESCCVRPLCGWHWQYSCWSEHRMSSLTLYSCNCVNGWRCCCEQMQWGLTSSLLQYCAYFSSYSCARVCNNTLAGFVSGVSEYLGSSKSWPIMYYPVQIAPPKGCTSIATKRAELACILQWRSCSSSSFCNFSSCSWSRVSSSCFCIASDRACSINAQLLSQGSMDTS